MFKSNFPNTQMIMLGVQIQFSWYTSDYVGCSN